jgi:protease I
MKDFDALVIPGRPRARQDAHAPRDGRPLARDAMDAGKPVAAICHGPQLLISATRCAAARSPAGRRSPSTSRTPAALRRQAGRRGRQSHHLRKPDDVPVFSEAIIRALSRVNV